MWPQLLNHLISFYKSSLGITLSHTEQSYLLNAYNPIDSLWLSNLSNITQIKGIMLAEAPLWGKQKQQYIYNLKKPKTTSFFYPKNLQDALAVNGLAPNPPLGSKPSLVRKLNDLGIIIIDVSPYALNTIDTSVNYPQLARSGKKMYYNLIQPTLSTFFDWKLKQCSVKLIDDVKSVKVFYRYSRVQKFLHADISTILNYYGLSVVSPPDDLISKRGGGVDKFKLAKVI